jgi:uncharacterized protein
MRIHLSQIPEAGLACDLRVSTADLPRLRAVCEEQDGKLEAALTLKERGGNVEVQGRLTGTVSVSCSRCAEPIPVPVDHEITVTMVPEAKGRALDADLRLSAGDLDVSFFDGEELDLREIVEEEVLLFDADGTCVEDEDGRCVRCGMTMEELFPEDTNDAVGHPFADLKHLLKT